MKTMLLSRLKTVVAVAFVLFVSVGAVGLTYRPGVAQSPPKPERPITDELEELRLEVAALRKGLEATRQRVKALEAEAQARTANAQPDPGNLENFRNEFGKTFSFRVTGAVNGTVWGTGVYTSDSPLATAAVHAGVLKVGQTGVVKVTIVPGQDAYQGSTQNGVTTSDYGPWPGAYRVRR